MMDRITRSFQVGSMLRVGRTKKIQCEFDRKELTFSCAANWIDYSIKCNDNSTGDMLECIFAHVKKDDPRINNMKDSHGKPMRDNLLIFQMPDNTCYLRFIPTILSPVSCFYAFNVENIIHSLELENNQPINEFIFHLDMYCKEMGYKIEEASFLLIDNVTNFMDDLKKQIPIAVKKNNNKLTSARFYGNFDSEEPFTAQYVDYHKHKEDEMFFDRNRFSEEMFWKSSKYQLQSELRIVIPNINFVEPYDPNLNYEYTKNLLKVNLPNLHKYARVYPAIKVQSLLFKYSKTNHTFHYELYSK